MNLFSTAAAICCGVPPETRNPWASSAPRSAGSASARFTSADSRSATSRGVPGGALQSEPADWPGVAYHRYWMHQDEFHNAYAHYGIRDQRYKLIYWYNQGLGLPGTQTGGQAPEWELFDCEKDPLELFNCYPDPAYQPQVARMTALLEAKMLEIGDDMLHLAR